MIIEHLAINFEKRKNKNSLNFCLGDPAPEDLIKAKENELDVSLPDQIKMFYTNYNGLKVENPHIEILSIEKLSKKGSKILFCYINKSMSLCFETKKINQARQWDIVNCVDNYLITLTFSSFWSNKIWAWIDKQTKIWVTDF